MLGSHINVFGLVSCTSASFCRIQKRKKEVTSLPLPYKYCHVFTLIGLFFCSANESRIRIQSCLQAILLDAATARSTVTIVDTVEILPRSHRSCHETLRKEIAANHASVFDELGNISSRVAVIEGQSPSTLQTVTAAREQSLPTTSIVPSEEHSLLSEPSQTEQHSLLNVDVRDTAEGAEDIPHEEADPTTATCDWGEREEEVPDYNQQIYWQPDSDSKDGDSRALSTTTAKIVRDAFSHSLPPAKRKSLKRKQPIPDTPFTKVPKLDPTIQSRMSPAAKATDRGIAGTQGYVLDAAVPLVNMLESARAGTLTPKDAAESAQQALKLIGNASAHLSSQRRQKASVCLKKELSTLVKDEDTFKDAAPFLFGSSFQIKMKEHMEAIRNLKQSSLNSSYGRSQSFRKSHHQQSHGGGSSRGRGRGQRKPQAGKHTQP